MNIDEDALALELARPLLDREYVALAGAVCKILPVQPLAGQLLLFTHAQTVKPGTGLLSPPRNPAGPRRAVSDHKRRFTRCIEAWQQQHTDK